MENICSRYCLRQTKNTHIIELRWAHELIHFGWSLTQLRFWCYIGNGGPSSSGEKMIRHQNTKSFNAFAKNSGFDSQIKHAVNQRLQKLSTDPINNLKDSTIKEEVKATKRTQSFKTKWLSKKN